MITLYTSVSRPAVEVKPSRDGPHLFDQSPKDLATYLYKCCPAETIRPIVTKLKDVLTVAGHAVPRGTLETALWDALRQMDEDNAS